MAILLIRQCPSTPFSEDAMKRYRLYFFDNFRLLGADQFEAGDAIDAIVEALRRADGREVELWLAGRKLGSFPAAEPLRRRPIAAERAPAALRSLSYA